VIKPDRAEWGTPPRNGEAVSPSLETGHRRA
jgi:hypothetical protein